LYPRFTNIIGSWTKDFCAAVNEQTGRQVKPDMLQRNVDGCSLCQFYLNDAIMVLDRATLQALECDELRAESENRSISVDVARLSTEVQAKMRHTNLLLTSAIQSLDKKEATRPSATDQKLIACLRAGVQTNVECSGLLSHEAQSNLAWASSTPAAVATVPDKSA
jgi:hypothetical protein